MSRDAAGMSLGWAKPKLDLVYVHIRFSAVVQHFQRERPTEKERSRNHLFSCSLGQERISPNANSRVSQTKGYGPRLSFLEHCHEDCSAEPDASSSGWAQSSAQSWAWAETSSLYIFSRKGCGIQRSSPIGKPLHEKGDDGGCAMTLWVHENLAGLLTTARALPTNDTRLGTGQNIQCAGVYLATSDDSSSLDPSSATASC